jgi:hypothetical protein
LFRVALGFQPSKVVANDAVTFPLPGRPLSGRPLPGPVQPAAGPALSR